MKIEVNYILDNCLWIDINRLLTRKCTKKVYLINSASKLHTTTDLIVKDERCKSDWEKEEDNEEDAKVI